MKFDQEKQEKHLTSLTRETFFFKNHAENETKGLVPSLFLHFKKALY